MEQRQNWDSCVCETPLSWDKFTSLTPISTQFGHAEMILQSDQISTWMDVVWHIVSASLVVPNTCLNFQKPAHQAIRWFSGRSEILVCLQSDFPTIQLEAN